MRESRLYLAFVWAVAALSGSIVVAELAGYSLRCFLHRGKLARSLRSLDYKRKLKTEAPMKLQLPAFSPFALLGLCLFSVPLHAQTAAATTKPLAPPKYDITREITLVGTVSSAIDKPTPEMHMLGGSHLLIETNSGRIDASLGVFPMTGDGGLSVGSGERVQVTGVMKTIRDRQVFVARLVRANGQVYKVRNRYGFVLMPPARTHNASSETKGGQL